MFNFLLSNKLTVLVFHRVPPIENPYAPSEMVLEQFVNTLDFIKENFHILPLTDAVVALKAGNLPPRAACLTFDDGYSDWLSGVVPVLQQNSIPATFYITTGQLHDLPLWSERILYAITHAKGLTDDGFELNGSGLPRLSLNSRLERIRAIAQLDRFLKYADQESREKYLRQLELDLGVQTSDIPRFTSDQLRDLHARGFEIGGHSVSHPILKNCNLAKAFHEIAGAKEELEGIIKGRVGSFAYPNGIPGVDFGPEHVEMVRKSGYTCAVTTHHGVATGATSPFQIPRFTPWGPSVRKMRFQMSRNFMRNRRELVELPPSEKKVLMIAFHFPPQAGSSGNLRTLNFVKNLPEKEWCPTVLTAKPHAYADQRNDLISSIPSYIRVERANAFDAARHLSIKGKYPRLFALPDRWSSWWFFAVIKGLQVIHKSKPSLIWSTFPITTAHLIGATLARLSGLPWVADFRDPMVSDDYPSNSIQRRFWKLLESYVLHHATACVFTTARAAAAYSQRYPVASGRCHVIENGYDEETFNDLEPNRYGASSGKLLLLHSGLIYPEDRNPSTFFAAINELLQSAAIARDSLCIRFRAAHHDAEVLGYAKEYGLQDIVEVAQPLPYKNAISEMMGADLLLVFQGSHFNAQIPAKIYEYLRAGRPVFAVVDPNGDTAVVLRQFSEVYISDIASVSDIRSQLNKVIAVAQTSVQAAALKKNIHMVRNYARKVQADRLAAYFDTIKT